MGFHYWNDPCCVLRENSTVDDGKNRGMMTCQLKRKRSELNCEQCQKDYGAVNPIFDYTRKQSRVSNQLSFEIFCPIRKKRSLRGKNSRFCSVSNLNLVPKFPEFNEEEKASLGLMMLSSGFTNWADFICAFDSSEKDSLISKAVALNRNETKIQMKLNCRVSGSGDVELDCDHTRVESCTKHDVDRDTEFGAKLNPSFSKLGKFNLKNEFKKPVDDVFEIKISDFKREKRNKFRTSDYTNFHECDICFKVFPSGRALGGHKKAHFSGFSENKSAVGVADSSFKKQIDSGIGLRPWWVKSDLDPEPVVISN